MINNNNNNLREFGLNSRHPGPLRVWKGGSELQFTMSFPRDPLDPLDPLDPTEPAANANVCFA